MIFANQGRHRGALFWILLGQPVVYGLSATQAIADPVKFTIPAGDATQSLNTFSQQTGLQIFFEHRIVEGRKTQAVAGRLEPAAALAMLLRESGLTFKFVNERTVSIRSTDLTKETTEKKTTATTPAAVLHLVDAQIPVVSDAGWEEKHEKTENAAKIKPSGNVEEMIVEDTKIKPFADANVDLPRTINDPQPYYIFDSKTIERSAAVNIEDFLKQRLTMNTTFQSSNQLFALDNSADGAGIPGSNNSSINLRGLGIDKTLILVNGRRVANVNYSRGSELRSYQPDLNGIPLAAVERIEVLPSSASAIYGGSAMGGVINIILKRNYQGGEVRYSYEAPASSSAATSTADAAYGLSFMGGKSHLTASAHYSTSKPMLLGDRAEFVLRGIDRIVRSGNISNLYSIFGSSTIGPTTNVYGLDANNRLANIVLDDGTDLGTPYAHIAPGATSAMPISQRLIPGYEFTLNPNGYGAYGLKQELGTPAEVSSLNLAFTHAVSSRIDAFAEFMMNENKTETSYSGTASAMFRLLQDNPGSPFRNARVYLLVGPTDRWPVESASLTSSMTLGFKGRFALGWSGELDYTLSKNRFEHSYAELSDGGTGLGLAFRNGQLDMLVDPNQLDLSKYFAPQPYDGSSRSDDFAVRLAGPMFHMPWGEATLALGLQRTKSSNPESTFLTNWFSPAEAPSDSNTSTTTYFAQSQTSDALYLESSIPLVTAKNSLPLIRALDLQMAQRTSRYIAQTGTSSSDIFNSDPPYITYSPVPIDAINGVGGTPTRSAASYSSHNETFGFKYQPVEAIVLRASIATAFLPPTNGQLRPDQRIMQQGGRVTTGAGFYRVDVISGGNPNLKPQSSRNMDAGLIYEPVNTLKGLRVNLEYYKIGQYDFIGTLTPDQILTVPELAAARVKRDTATGLVTLVDVSLVNIAEYSTSGVDLSLSYSKPTAFGTFDFYLMGTQVNDERRQLVINTPLKDYVRFPFRGGPVEHKANASLGWTQRQWTLGWTTTWFGNYRVAGTPGDPVSLSPSFAATQGSYSIPAQMYHHLFASYTFGEVTRSKMFSGVSLQLNVGNVFNTTPPVDMAMQPFYLSPLGDVRLRTFRLSVKKGF